MFVVTCIETETWHRAIRMPELLQKLLTTAPADEARIYMQVYHLPKVEVGAEVNRLVSMAQLGRELSWPKKSRASLRKMSLDIGWSAKLLQVPSKHRGYGNLAQCWLVVPCFWQYRAVWVVHCQH